MLGTGLSTGDPQKVFAAIVSALHIPHRAWSPVGNCCSSFPYPHPKSGVLERPQIQMHLERSLKAGRSLTVRKEVEGV